VHRIGIFSLLSAAIALSAGGNVYDKYFASRILAIPDDPNPRLASKYAIVFTPTRNDFGYEVQYAGKNALGGNACWSGDSAVQMSLEQLKDMKLATTAGGTLKVGGDSTAPSAELTGSINAERNIQVNNVFGAYYVRNEAIVEREFHWRVVVYGQNRQVLYKTGWNNGQGDDIKSWAWSGNCAWVKQ
jgi:hypothetical protein